MWLVHLDIYLRVIAACSYNHFPLPVFLMAVLLTLACLPRTSARCRDTKGYVYILEEKNQNNNYYKIGGSIKGAETRIRQIQIGNPRELSKVGQIEVKSCSKAEALVHQYARSSRLRYVTNIVIKGKPTEWYRINANDNRNINNLKADIRKLLSQRQMLLNPRTNWYEELMERLFSLA